MEMERAKSVLRAEGVRKAFDGLRAVDNVDFELRAGEVVALIGPNGAGKTTLLNVLSGQLRPDAGRVVLAGRDVTRWPPHARARAGLARTFQIPQLAPSLTVREHVEAARLRGRLRGRRPEPEGLLHAVGLGDKRDVPAGALAHGDRRLLELALALALEPKALLLDEPAAGLRPAEVERFLQLVRGLRAERDDLAILLVEHDMDVVFELAERVVVLHRGRVLAEGPPPAIREHPDVQAVYLGARP